MTHSILVIAVLVAVLVQCWGSRSDIDGITQPRRRLSGALELAVRGIVQRCWGVFARLARVWRRVVPGRGAAQVHAAATLFVAQQSELERSFLDKAQQQAQQQGKPRGLVWKACHFQGPTLLARDRVSQQLYALVSVSVALEAVPGGGMEQVAAVGNWRCATALFEYRDRSWTPQGRTLFNLEPAQAVAHYEQALEPLGEIQELARRG